MKVENLVSAATSGAVPRRGDIDLPQIGHATFRFHGRGCYVVVDKIQIDIELCNDTDAVGFDSWRICRYATETLGLPNIDSDDIEEGLQKLQRENRLSFSKECPYFGLYFIPTEADVC